MPITKEQFNSAAHDVINVLEEACDPELPAAAREATAILTYVLQVIKAHGNSRRQRATQDEKDKVMALLLQGVADANNAS